MDIGKANSFSLFLDKYSQKEEREEKERAALRAEARKKATPGENGFRRFLQSISNSICCRNDKDEDEGDPFEVFEEEIRRRKEFHLRCFRLHTGLSNELQNPELVQFQYDPNKKSDEETNEEIQMDENEETENARHQEVTVHIEPDAIEMETLICSNTA